MLPELMTVYFVSHTHLIYTQKQLYNFIFGFTNLYSYILQNILMHLQETFQEYSSYVCCVCLVVCNSGIIKLIIMTFHNTEV